LCLLLSRVLKNICNYHFHILWSIGKEILTSHQHLELKHQEPTETYYCVFILHRHPLVCIKYCSILITQITILIFFYCYIDSPNSRKKKVYEQHENEENSLRCPVKLYEFYLSKWLLFYFQFNKHFEFVCCINIYTYNSFFTAQKVLKQEMICFTSLLKDLVYPIALYGIQLVH